MWNHRFIPLIDTSTAAIKRALYLQQYCRLQSEHIDDYAIWSLHTNTIISKLFGRLFSFGEEQLPADRHLVELLLHPNP
jgi:hypothetical protein